ncbi:MAG: DNA-binding protein [Gammaproteobacteria bacterium]|nr:DNA-binding protein [Gammaproteobacteria bacterium]
MAKSGITYEEFIAVAQDLEKLGEKLSVNRIKELLGNRGSPAIINRFIKEWSGQAETDQAPSTPHFELTSETMQQPLNSKTEDSGNQSTHNAPAAGNVIESREAQGTDALHHEPSSAASGAAKAQPQAKVPTPFDEPKENYQQERLEDLDDNALIIKIRRLETLLAKEQSRREAADKMAEEAKEYADIIKEQIGQRVADLKQSMEVTINQLKAEAREMKHNADCDLKFYRDQLQKANVKIVSLLTGQAPEPAISSNPEPASSKDSADSAAE